VVRGDAAGVTIGAGANVQDHVVIQTTKASGATIGANVTIGHNAVLTGCTVGEGCLIGMGAVVGEGAVVEAHTMVAAGAVLASGAVATGKKLWAGNPAKAVRDLSAKELAQLPFQADEYCKLAEKHSAAVRALQ